MYTRGHMLSIILCLTYTCRFDVVTALHTLRENAMRFCGTNRICEKGYSYYVHTSNFATLMNHNFVEIFT